MILCAAIRYTFVNDEGVDDTVTLMGYRHGECIRIWGKYIKPHCKQKIQEVQGFITDEGKFLDRVSARKHFIECGQGTPKFPNELYSEDLYDGCSEMWEEACENVR